EECTVGGRGIYANTPDKSRATLCSCAERACSVVSVRIQSRLSETGEPDTERTGGFMSGPRTNRGRQTPALRPQRVRGMGLSALVLLGLSLAGCTGGQIAIGISPSAPPGANAAEFASSDSPPSSQTTESKHETKTVTGSSTFPEALRKYLRCLCGDPDAQP